VYHSFLYADVPLRNYSLTLHLVYNVSAVGRKKLVECGLMSEIICLLADDSTGAELQETVLDLLASLCDAGKFQI